MLMSGCFMMQNSEDIAEDFVGRNFACAGSRTILWGGAVSYLNCLSMETPSTLSWQNRGRSFF